MASSLCTPRRFLCMSSGEGERVQKRARKEMLVGTHDGTFHADEALACFMLRTLHSGADVLRTRDPEKLAGCDIVVDVGGVFDVSSKRFDHHQRGFMETFDSKVKMMDWMCGSRGLFGMCMSKFLG